MFHTDEWMAFGALGGPPLAVVVVAGFVVVGAVVVGLAVVVVTAGFVVVGLVVVVEPPPLHAATSDNTPSNTTTRNQGASLFVTMLLSLLSILTYQLVKLIGTRLQNITRREAKTSFLLYTKSIVIGKVTGHARANPLPTAPPRPLTWYSSAAGRSDRTHNRRRRADRSSAPNPQPVSRGT